MSNERDFFRDTWVRYLGYANEVGESFRGVVPRNVVKTSYTIAFAYVLADTADKSWKMLRHDGRPIQVVKAAGDALLWQTLASIVIPGIAINRICCYSNSLLGKHAKVVPPPMRRILVVGIGLASIPIIVHPIDVGVTILMNQTYRRWIM